MSYKVGDWIRVTRGNDVIEGRISDDYDEMLEITNSEHGDYLTIWPDTWTIEVISKPIVLPTKRDAIVRIDRLSYALMRPGDALPWVGDDLNGFSDYLIRLYIEQANGFTVIFEGADE